MQIRYEDFDITINHSYNMIDRQEFTMKIIYKGKGHRFLLEGYRTDPDKPGIWKLHLLGTQHKKIVASMINKDLYRDVLELIGKVV